MELECVESFSGLEFGPEVLGVLTDTELMDGIDLTPPSAFFPPSISEQDVERVACWFDKSESDGCVNSVLAPGKTPLRVGKSGKVIDINDFHLEIGHLC